MLTGQKGAMVLGHSLRDIGTKKQLAVLITLDTVSSSTLDKLKVQILATHPIGNVADIFGRKCTIKSFPSNVLSTNLLGIYTL